MKITSFTDRGQQCFMVHCNPQEALSLAIGLLEQIKSGSSNSGRPEWNNTMLSIVADGKFTEKKEGCYFSVAVEKEG